MTKRSKKFWLILASVLLAVLACYQFFREVYVEDNKRIRTSLREAVKERYPETAEEPGGIRRGLQDVDPFGIFGEVVPALHRERADVPEVPAAEDLELGRRVLVTALVIREYFVQPTLVRDAL